jgi:hypothetical protein
MFEQVEIVYRPTYRRPLVVSFSRGGTNLILDN